MAKIKKIKLGNTTYDICDAGAATKKYVDDGLSRKLNTVGGSITGNLEIAGNLTVRGTTTTEKAETLAVKDSVIVTNADGAALGATLSGIAIKKDGENTYGVMYDPSDDSVKLGLGTLDAENSFTFNESGTDGKAIATRADSSALTDGHLVSWDGTTNSLVDSGKKTDDFIEKWTPNDGGLYKYVYAVNKNGEQFHQLYTENRVGFSIVSRNGKGQSEFADPTADAHAATKKYVDDNFVPKKTSTTGTQIYAFDNNGLKDVHMSAGATESGIAYKDNGGVLAVGTPTGLSHATTKAYVDAFQTITILGADE